MASSNALISTTTCHRK